MSAMKDGVGIGKVNGIFCVICHILFGTPIKSYKSNANEPSAATEVTC